MNQAAHSGFGGRQQSGFGGGVDLGEQQFDERLFGLGEFVGEDAVQPPVRRDDEPRGAAVARFAVEHLDDRGDVEAQPGNGIGQLRGGGRPPGARVGHRVGDDCQQQLILAGEVAVERLQRDAGLFDQLLGGEGRRPFPE